MTRIIKKIKINTVLELVTGLHIGGSTENVEIGGIDTPVIKLSTNNKPYIPGSSLKGKMRCLLEQVRGAEKVGKSDEVNNMFGYSEGNRISMPSKIIVRDAYLTTDSENELKRSEHMDMPYTESKHENVIDRVTGKAEHPRITERVPAGAKFNVEFVLNIWDEDREDKMIDMLKEAMRLLENDYLGGSGSRGYGQVAFKEIEPTELSADNNWGRK